VEKLLELCQKIDKEIKKSEGCTVTERLFSYYKSSLMLAKYLRNTISSGLKRGFGAVANCSGIGRAGEIYSNSRQQLRNLINSCRENFEIFFWDYFAEFVESGFPRGLAIIGTALTIATKFIKENESKMVRLGVEITVFYISMLMIDTIRLAMEGDRSRLMRTLVDIF
jgi:hypothetical protein